MAGPIDTDHVGPTHLNGETSEQPQKRQTQQNERSDTHTTTAPLHLEVDPLEISGLGQAGDVELDNPVFANSGKPFLFVFLQKPTYSNLLDSNVTHDAGLQEKVMKRKNLKVITGGTCPQIFGL